MERADWSGVAHEDMRFMGPYGERHLEQALRQLRLPDRPRVIDVGCGNGAMLEHLAATRGATGTGVDLVPVDRKVPGICFVEADAVTHQDDGSYDLAMSIGSVGTPAMLASLVRPGGGVVWGEGYWQEEPDAALLDALGADRDELDSLEGMVERGRAAGLVPAQPVVSTDDDWDAYEDGWAANGERYAAAHPEEPGIEDFLAWIRAGRRRYRELGGRGALGFALMPFTRPR
jgi:SAM-dependent methyltransferase